MAIHLIPLNMFLRYSHRTLTDLHVPHCCEHSTAAPVTLSDVLLLAHWPKPNLHHPAVLMDTMLAEFITPIILSLILDCKLTVQSTNAVSNSTSSNSRNPATTIPYIRFYPVRSQSYDRIRRQWDLTFRKRGEGVVSRNWISASYIKALIRIILYSKHVVIILYP
jgi:hypothetical protein